MSTSYVEPLPETRRRKLGLFHVGQASEEIQKDRVRQLFSVGNYCNSSLRTVGSVRTARQCSVMPASFFLLL